MKIYAVVGNYYKKYDKFYKKRTDAEKRASELNKPVGFNNPYLTGGDRDYYVVREIDVIE